MLPKFSRISLAVFVFAAFVFVAGLITGCDEKHASAGSPPISPAQVAPAPAADYKVTRRTPSGLTLTSSRTIPADVDAVADASFARLITDSRAAGYTTNLDARLYTIIIKQDCELSPGGTLSWRISAPDYDGTEYDVNPAPGVGEVYAAEQVIMNGYVPTHSFIICYADADLMARTVRYGGEHPILYDNDRARYNQTANHGTSGIGHPLIAEGN